MATSHHLRLDMSKEDFLKDLYSFMEAKAQPITKVPSLGYQELDLFHLYQLVISRGGMDEVTRRQEWKSVYQDLGIPTMSTSASYNTRTNYKKYLYLYELEHCNFDDPTDDPSAPRPKYTIGQYIRIVSEVYEGQVFYAQVLKCRYRGDRIAYYVRYNGWSSSHDEWMPEDVLGELLGDEQTNPEGLQNPPPSRSSKSNRIIEEPLLVPGERPLPHFSTSRSLSSSSGISTPKSIKKRARISAGDHYGSSDGDEGGRGDGDDDEDDDNDNDNGEDRSGNDSSSTSEELLPRRSGNMSLRKIASTPNLKLSCPLDRAPIQPDWDLIKQELLEAELNDSEKCLSIREYHVHHNAHTSVPIYPRPIDTQELEFLEGNSFDLEPGEVLLKAKIAKFKDGFRAAPHHVPELDDPRPLDEIRASVEAFEDHLFALEKQYRRNVRLMYQIKSEEKATLASGHDSRGRPDPAHITASTNNGSSNNGRSRRR